MRAATAEITLMIPLSEHTDHKLLARLTTANSVIISSQETSGKSAVGNVASALAAEFSLQISVLYPSTRFPISISFRVACGLNRHSRYWIKKVMSWLTVTIAIEAFRLEKNE